MNQQKPLPIDENVICTLEDFSVIKITGDDAQSFLQSQFSNDVKALASGKVQFNSYNSPKGRMYASFYLAHVDNVFYMTVPRDIVEMLIKRLRMFVMRSKVTLEDLSPVIQCYGLNGEQVINQLAGQVKLPGNAMEVSTAESNVLLKLSEQRLICFGENATSLIESLGESFTQADSHHWRRLDIHAGIPNIFASSQEEFVAQMVNLPLVGGVSFTKGCYPGQEVVARMHYLGKLKKRMYRVTITTNQAPDPADNIYERGSGNTQSVGQIVDAQLNDSGTVDALAVLQIKSAEESVLSLGTTEGAEITLDSLPYAFEEK